MRPLRSIPCVFFFLLFAVPLFALLPAVPFQVAGKIIPAGVLECFVTGHDFSRAANAIESMWALAPAGCSSGSRHGKGAFSAASLAAQKDKPEPLTEAQIEEIREAGIEPNERVSLYTKFTGEHADTIKSLTNRATSIARAKRIDEELQDLTALMDEFGSNLDVFSERHADIRKSLKLLTEATDRWLGILRALPGEPGFDLARKEAIESGEDLADQAKRLLTEQTEYFNLHKDEQNQDRAEPK
jgi:hypothetical protein